MVGVKRWAAACLLTAGFATSGQAQGFVPGGWSQQFGFESFANPGFMGGAGLGFGTPGLGGFNAFGGGFGPYGQSIALPDLSGIPPGWTMSPPLTANTIDPLARTIRQATRRRRGR